jgi:hypothetical protein
LNAKPAKPAENSRRLFFAVLAGSAFHPVC